VRRLGLVGLAGAALGLAAEWVGFGWGDPRHWVPDLTVGWTFIGCGLVASRRRPESHTGPLMAATGLTWFLGNFASVGVAAVAWAAAHLVYLHRGPLCSWCSPTRPGGQGRDWSEAPSRSAMRWP
jgi:peptidoglycan/LPS O-acetylase OafA/YrhL